GRFVGANGIRPRYDRLPDTIAFPTRSPSRYDRLPDAIAPPTRSHSDTARELTKTEMGASLAPL
ncbi:MAG: hypothetical protein ACP5D7_06040, partial [Limnospira sp.]